MAITAPRNKEPELVEVITSGDVERAVTKSLTELGLSFAELDAQARQGRFSSDQARLVWLAIRNVATPA